MRGNYRLVPGCWTTVMGFLKERCAFLGFRDVWDRPSREKGKKKRTYFIWSIFSDLADS